MTEKQYTGYVDHEYLRVLAAMVAPVKKLSYELMEVSPQDRVLDAGCGPGVDTIPIGLEHTSGLVAGVDRDIDMLRRALDNHPPHNVTHIAANADALPFHDAVFDACRSERLLQHLGNPAAAIRECVRVVRPGGKIVLVDTDHSTLSIDTVYTEIEWKFRTFYCQRLANGTSGRGLFRLLKEAGAKNVQVRAFPFVQHSFTALRMVTNFDAVSADAVEQGVMSPAEAALFADSCRELEKKGLFYSFVSVIVADGIRQ